MIELAIIASGSGSNAEQIVNYFKNHRKIKVSLILSNKPDSFVIKRAKKLSVPFITFTREELQNGSVLVQLKCKIDFVVLAGFLLKIPSDMIMSYPNRIINIHPSLLPKYGGKGMYGFRVHKKVLANKEKETGITIHYVNEFYDQGKIIFQAKTPVFLNDTVEDIAKRVHELEYKYFPRVIEKEIERINIGQ